MDASLRTLTIDELLKVPGFAAYEGQRLGYGLARS